jgi:hypothetical protein
MFEMPYSSVRLDYRTFFSIQSIIKSATVFQLRSSIKSCAVSAQTDGVRAETLCGEIRQKVFFKTPSRVARTVDEKKRRVEFQRLRLTAYNFKFHLKRRAIWNLKFFNFVFD